MNSDKRRSWERFVTHLQGYEVTSLYYFLDWRIVLRRHESEIDLGIFLPWAIVQNDRVLLGKDDLALGRADPVMNQLDSRTEAIPSEEEVVLMQKLGRVTSGEFVAETVFVLRFDSGLELQIFQSRRGRGLLLYMELPENKSFVIDSTDDGYDEGDRSGSSKT